MNLPIHTGNGSITSSTNHTVESSGTVLVNLHDHLPDVRLQVIDREILSKHDVSLGLNWLKEMEREVDMKVRFNANELHFFKKGRKLVKLKSQLPFMMEYGLKYADVNEVLTIKSQRDAGTYSDCEARQLLFVMETTDLEAKEPETGDRLQHFLRDMSGDAKERLIKVIDGLINALHKEFDDNVIVDELPAQLPPDRPATDHRVPLIEGAALPRPARFNYDPESAKVINELVDKMLQLGHIQPSSSPVAAACFLVKQKGK